MAFPFGMAKHFLTSMKSKDLVTLEQGLYQKTRTEIYGLEVLEEGFIDMMVKHASNSIVAMGLAQTIHI